MLDSVRMQTWSKLNMFVIVRAITYAVLFIGLLLIYVPTCVLSWSGIVPPTAIEGSCWSPRLARDIVPIVVSAGDESAALTARE